ncbi:hypothetical protein HDU80_007375 [Chytriomyces hyalinus]|nr:hypothetical protein HDU80_007375 [Chytriomyces hyalinus]
MNVIIKPGCLSRNVIGAFLRGDERKFAARATGWRTFKNTDSHPPKEKKQTQNKINNKTSGNTHTMAEREAVVDYNAVEKKGSSVVWTKVGLDLFAELMRETDNRNPSVFSLKAADPEFIAAGELEVVENHLRQTLRAYKNACKKKSPQSAWKPVFAALEALTMYMQSKNTWVTSTKHSTRAANAFTAYGCAWVCVAEKLNDLGLFVENSYPSVRCAVNSTLAVGNELNEKVGHKMSDWPAKLEAIWTDTPYAGEKKKPYVNENADTGAKKKSKKKKGEEYDDEDEEAGGKKRKGSKKSGSPATTQSEPANPWDFEEAIARLKEDRKQIGGSDFDIAVMTEDLRAKLAVAAD